MGKKKKKEFFDLHFFIPTSSHFIKNSCFDNLVISIRLIFNTIVLLLIILFNSIFKLYNNGINIQNCNIITIVKLFLLIY
jgi:hypothetical protein